MARCKNTTVFYVPNGTGGEEVKAVIRCGLDVHEPDEQCLARIADSRPAAVLVWVGDHGPVKR